MPHTYSLRGGASTEDPRLDRLVQFDERSRGFSIRPLISPQQAKKPRSYTWRCLTYNNQGQEGACFPAGTFVRMADGSQCRIEAVRTLDEVVTAEGRTGTVIATMARPANRGLVSVAVGGHVPVRCTPEHPFLTPTGYVAAEALRPGDLVAVTRYAALTDEPLDVASIVDASDLRGVIAGTVNEGGVLVEVAPMPSLLGRTPALGRLIGLYAAEGHTTPNKVVWSYGRHEEDSLVEDTVALIKAALGAQPRVQHRPNGAINVVLYGKTWRRLFAALVPGTSKHGDKHLSRHVTQGNREYLRALLRGWQDGDGHVRRTSVQGVTVCRRLALDMHAIATALGDRSVLRSTAPSLNSHAASRQRRYDLTVGTGGGSARSAHQDDAAVWRKVESVTPEPFDGWVFNIEVEGDHSYVADGIGVHNCVGFAWGHELSARPAEVEGIDEVFAREKIYRPAQKIDAWEGETYEGTSVLAGAKILNGLGYMDEYRWAFGLDDLVLAVGYKGPAVLGIPWYTGMFDTGPDGFVRVSGRVAGGHAILCRGVNVASGYFLLHNSWGRRWGVGGTAKITFADLNRLLNEYGEACIPVRRVRRPLPRAA